MTSARKPSAKKSPPRAARRNGVAPLEQIRRSVVRAARSVAKKVRLGK